MVLPIDVDRARALTPGCAQVLHLNHAGASLLPQLSVAILEKMAEGALPKRLQIGVDAEQSFTAYKLLIPDVVDGRLEAVPRGEE